jgi:hypothetical protein
LVARGASLSVSGAGAVRLSGAERAGGARLALAAVLSTGFIMIIVVLFAIAAVLGVVLAVRHFQGQPLPMPLAATHGVFGALGILGLFFYGSSSGFSDQWKLALGIFVVVALGGFTMVAIHMKKGKPPTPILILHALGAVIAFGLLLMAAL